MRSKVHVVSEATFKAWLASQVSTRPPERRRLDDRAGGAG